MKNLFFLRKIFFVFSFLWAITALAQTGVRITYYTGAIQDYTVENTGKLYFSGSYLLVKTTATANDVSIPTNIIRKITFTTASLATQEIGENKSKFKLYPNPASDYIMISSDKKQKLNVKIYSSAGILVLKGSYQPNEQIYISGLTAGFYLVQVDESTFKMIKK